MIKYCLEKWDKNKNELKENIKNDTEINSCNYKYLVKKVIDIILNDNSKEKSGILTV